jgi:hypothetical protein
MGIKYYVWRSHRVMMALHEYRNYFPKGSMPADDL